MECLIGIKGQDFVLLAADSVSARSIVAMKHGKEAVLLGDNVWFWGSECFPPLRLDSAPCTVKVMQWEFMICRTVVRRGNKQDF